MLLYRIVVRRMRKAGAFEIQEFAILSYIHQLADPVEFSINKKIDVIARLHRNVIGKGSFMVLKPLTLGGRKKGAVNARTQVKLKRSQIVETHQVTGHGLNYGLVTTTSLIS